MSNIGKRVLITNGYWKDKVFNGSFKPVYGVVENQYQSEDRSYHGSPSYDTITVVKGDDGRSYTDDRDQNCSKDWKNTTTFFTADKFASAVRHAVKEQEEIIAHASCAIDKLKSTMFSLNFSMDVDHTKSSFLDNQIQTAAMQALSQRLAAQPATEIECDETEL